MDPCYLCTLLDMIQQNLQVQYMLYSCWQSVKAYNDFFRDLCKLEHSDMYDMETWPRAWLCGLWVTNQFSVGKSPIGERVWKVLLAIQQVLVPWFTCHINQWEFAGSGMALMLAVLQKSHWRCSTWSQPWPLQITAARHCIWCLLITSLAAQPHLFLYFKRGAKESPLQPDHGIFSTCISQSCIFLKNLDMSSTTMSSWSLSYVDLQITPEMLMEQK